MAKRTAIIDIGSNSARLAIFQHTSKTGFHLVCEQKSRVRIGEGAYAHQGKLQKAGMTRAFNTLESFMQTIAEYKVSKVIAVATSALRDAPNKHLFLEKVSKKLGLDIKIIHGKEEAFYGAVAANNLLPFTDGITIDIGGGSSDMAIVKEGKITETFSLDLGTVRLKELFYDKGANADTARHYIHTALKALPASFHSNIAIGIGGTARTLAKAIIQKSAYPLDKLHAFNYLVSDYTMYFEELSTSSIEVLPSYHIKENRHDTIREGALIFLEILRHIGAKEVITSGVGVREGLFLHHKLRKAPYKLPAYSNPSVTSIRDRFDILSLPHGNKREILRKLYALFSSKFDTSEEYNKIMETVLGLSSIGKVLTIYHQNRHANYIAMQELNYGFTHNEMVLISLLLYTKAKRGYHKALYTQYKTLLPPKKTVKWLAFIYTLTLILHRNSAKATYTFRLDKETLFIQSNKSLYLAFQDISEMKRPKNLVIKSGMKDRGDL